MAKTEVKIKHESMALFFTLKKNANLILQCPISDTLEQKKAQTPLKRVGEIELHTPQDRCAHASF